MSQHKKSLTQKQKIIIYISAALLAVVAAVIAVIILVIVTKNPPPAILNSSVQSNTSQLSSTNTSSINQLPNTDTTNSSIQVEGIKNGTIYYTTQCATIVGDNITSISLNGQEQNNQFFIDGNTTNMHVIEITDSSGKITTYVVYTQPIYSLLEPIQELNSHTVTADDYNTIIKVKNAAQSLKTDYSTMSEIADIEKVVKYCDNFLTRLDSVATKIDEITKICNKYFENPSIEENNFNANEVISDIDLLLVSKNITNEQRNTLSKLRSKCATLLPNIPFDQPDTPIAE